MTEVFYSAPAPTTRRVRAYFAPVDRTSRIPTVFDPALQCEFDPDHPPPPWTDLGWIQKFQRKPASRMTQVSAGNPAVTLEQVVESVSAEVSCEFLSWSKLSMALATGSQHMNILAAQPGAIPTGSGGTAKPAVEIQSGSTANSILLLAADASQFVPGMKIAVDTDYIGESGYVGAPIAGAFIRSPLNDLDYIRRVTFNVGVIADVTSDRVTLANALPGGSPRSDAKLQQITGFVDREGGCFHLEWSALFVMEGTQGEKIYYHYPRLQAINGAEEGLYPIDASDTGYDRVLLIGRFLALPVTDSLDGEKVVCYRSFIPAPNALI